MKTIAPSKPNSLALFCLGAGALLLVSAQARATIGVSLQMQLGNPSSATSNTNNHDHYLVQRTVEALDFSDNLGEPNWASWDLTSGDVGSAGRSSSFYTDTTLPGNFYHVSTSDYTGSGFDRGHMCPSDDRTDTTADNKLVFYMSNIVPQTPDNNQGPWENLEAYCRTLAAAGDELLITCGPSGFSGSRIQPSGKVSIPGYTWKIIVDVPHGSGSALSRINASTRVITVKVPNISGIRTTPWTNYLTSVNQIQSDTGYTFFTALPADVAAALRAKIDGQQSPPPATSITISQVYGGGGNSGATYKNDFIELYNAGTSSVDLSAYAVQYTSASGSSWQETKLTGSLAAGHHYLIQEAAGSGGTKSLPTPQVTGSISMSATAGKIALTKTQTLLTVDNPLGNSAVVDFVGFGSADVYEGTGHAPAPSNTTADLRANAGATDTNNNAADFSTGAPNPRNN
ncbi:MAG TPA: DNA/RNA non-specific endonuclease [Verrucomicrobiae bacterium]|nr:DNA/RNA non-specific endonuclease [Verrucomicrobiae bacterium]